MKNVAYGFSLILMLFVFFLLADTVFGEDPHHDVEDICSVERIEGGVEICCESDDDSNHRNDNSDSGSCVIIMDGEDGSDGSDGQDGKDGYDGRGGSDGDDGSDGADGVDGANGLDGEDGADGIDGQDGESCTVVDNLDATCTIICVNSEALVYDCGSGVEVIEEDVPAQLPGLCGSFGGFTIIGMLLTLGFMKSRSRRYRI